MIFLEFITQYYLILMPVLFGLLLVFAVVNWIYDPYRKQNRKIDSCRQKISSYPEKIATYIPLLPQEYQRQWRAYINTKAEKPSLTLEFVKSRCGILLWRLVVITAVAVSSYILAYFIFSQK